MWEEERKRWERKDEDEEEGGWEEFKIGTLKDKLIWYCYHIHFSSVAWQDLSMYMYMYTCSSWCYHGNPKQEA